MYEFRTSNLILLVCKERETESEREGAREKEGIFAVPAKPSLAGAQDPCLF